MINTELGQVKILNTQEILCAIENEINELASNSISENPVVALTGGSTPKAFYKYISEKDEKPDNWDSILWTTSDERYVPTSDDESNFGNAERGMMDTLGISSDKKWIWQTELTPEGAAKAYNDSWNEKFSADTCYDLCFLGMGDDCHTASLFPGSPLIQAGVTENFASVEVPGKGMRLTITEAGFEKCGRIVITVTGAGKQEALKQVFKEEINFKQKPVQLLKNYSEKVLWLIDQDAAGNLFE